MGIQGLLPALKSIQATKPLSEFSGQTIAVDAYVWLHRAVFNCATELATGKPTHRYVNYAMERVRLLRHHGVEPYIVFDGGPLPAKKGTEVERKRKRDEHLARGNLLASQGNHSQARECYLKSVDVTPQMAYQLIKARLGYFFLPTAPAHICSRLCAQSLFTVLTEDSDLLVFGCKNVLLKFDSVACTVVSISRSDFGSITANASDPNSVSLVGWSDVQFRAMAILSGCDYLPSIPGIGLKTACAMLRKWKTPQGVVRQIGLDGKKRVPKGYLAHFKLAEKCFLHQRVYDPLSEKLVYLTDVDLDGWDDSAEAYIGNDLEPGLAKKLAMGDLDPMTLGPIEDINPNFRPSPRILRELPNGLSPKNKGKSKGKKPATGGILNFFGAYNFILRPKSPLPQKNILQQKLPVTAGKASGKRTLAEVLDQDLVAKRKRKKPSSVPTTPNETSKFFVTSIASNVRPASIDFRIGPSSSRTGKENIGCRQAGEEVEESVGDADSVVAQGRVDSEMQDDLRSADNFVEQEDGYLSPSRSMSRDIEDLSSPLRFIPSRSRPISPQADPDDFDLEVDPISSPPPIARAQILRPGQLSSPNQPHVRGPPKVLVERSPVISAKTAPPKHGHVIDLGDSFGDESSSEIDCYGSDDDQTPSPSPLTPEEEPVQDVTSTRVNSPEGLEDSEERELLGVSSRTVIVAAGWRKAWAFDSRQSGPVRQSRNVSEIFLQRRETNVTPTGRYRLSQAAYTQPLLHTPLASNKVSGGDKSSTSSRRSRVAVGNPVGGRKQLTFDEISVVDNVEAAGSDVKPVPDMPEHLTRLRFERFR
ncbi:hypothetical protein D9757_004079 [Collybiopsis confluens]|uniref:XPG N-terminal domain-containing protein n=1 Tax=Collybiopsis confluens TaxID=2823264 RepID=A0A8H5MD25_9AGAR|nr:hypothetical protein D9757_004079 [Collybiopsis confluens]